MTGKYLEPEGSAPPERVGKGKRRGFRAAGIACLAASLGVMFAALLGFASGASASGGIAVSAACSTSGDSCATITVTGHGLTPGASATIRVGGEDGAMNEEMGTVSGTADASGVLEGSTADIYGGTWLVGHTYHWLVNGSTTGTLVLQAYSSGSTPPPSTQSISAKALTDHECNSTEWHFVITQVDKKSDAPASIHVTWDNGQSEDVSLDKFTGGVAHYTTTDNLGAKVTSATAEIYGDWSGQFNLSHGPCGSGSSTPPESSTPTFQPYTIVCVWELQPPATKDNPFAKPQLLVHCGDSSVPEDCGKTYQIDTYHVDSKSDEQVLKGLEESKTLNSPADDAPLSPNPYSWQVNDACPTETTTPPESSTPPETSTPPESSTPPVTSPPVTSPPVTSPPVTSTVPSTPTHTKSTTSAHSSTVAHTTSSGTPSTTPSGFPAGNTGDGLASTGGPNKMLGAIAAGLAGLGFIFMMLGGRRRSVAPRRH